MQKHSEAKKEVNKIMGGEIYETASEKLLKKGRKEGVAIGETRARQEDVEQFAQYFLSNNQAKTIEEARELARSIIKK